MTETKKKELYDLVEKLVYPSWTWAKLDKEEKDRFNSAMVPMIEYTKIQGTLIQRKTIIKNLYHMFLVGLGYTGWEWREGTEQENDSSMETIDYMN